ncbi:MAG: AAA family ATPase, partial [Leptospiraceae bacterium]|nr:AAA family ATPase [Leptospiraceae bacterium]
DKNVLIQQVKEIFVDSFRNPEDRKSQWDLVASELAIQGEYISPEVKIFVDENNFYCNDKKIPVMSSEKVKKTIETIPFTAEIRQFVEKISTCLEMKENVLIEYSDEDDPLFLMELITGLTGNEVEFVNLCKGIHTSDILGALKPTIDNKIEWANGPLTRGMEKGALIVITALEASGAELVEKLNMLTDDARSILLPPESGYEGPLTLKENSHVIAFKTFRKTKSTPTISRAFRNRFTSIRFPEFTDRNSLKEIVEFFLPTSSLTEVMVSFHIKIRELSQRRVIGSANLSPYTFGLTNLVKWTKHILNYNGPDLPEIILRGAKIAYTNQIYDIKERNDINRTLENGIKSGKLPENLFKEIEDKKKTLTLETDIDKKRWWDPALHYRDPITGKAKLKMQGNPLKKGIEINTPETGGNTKEGADAWYGTETRGNMGQGEPAGGGGAWGYRTEELYKQFLAKRKILWSYSMPVSRKEFQDVFGKELENTEMNLEKLFDPEIDITRMYQFEGRRIDARKYISFKSGKGDIKVFDKTIIDKKDEKLKGVEVVFLVSKARRIFNFEYSIVVLSALISSSIILSDHNVDFSIYLYSDRLNKKDNIDLSCIKQFEEEYTDEKEEEIFQALSTDWQGDSVHEYVLLENCEKYFTADSTTRILVMISDFRGQRGKAKVDDEISSFENRKLKEAIIRNQNKSYIFLGVGMGNRYIAEELFHESIQITGENFSNMPNLLGTELSRLILTHHSV